MKTSSSYMAESGLKTSSVEVSLDHPLLVLKRSLLGVWGRGEYRGDDATLATERQKRRWGPGLPWASSLYVPLLMLIKAFNLRMM